MKFLTKTIFAFAILSFFSTEKITAQCSSNEVEITIELSTDNYGYEAYWELLDASNNVLDSGGNPKANPPGQQVAANTDAGAYGNNSSYTFDICVADPSISTFKLYDDYSDGGTTAKIYVDGVLIFSNEDDPVAFGSLLTETISVPLPNLDLGITNASPEGKINKGYKNYVTVNVQNFGSNDVTSFKLTWTVGNENVRTQTVSGVNITPGQNQEITADLGWEADAIGNKTLTVSISEINGTEDDNQSNDELTKSIDVFQRERVALSELWTNAGCNPCALYVPGLVEKIKARPSYTYQISHQSDWPGFDPMNQHNPTEVATRGNYYGISSSSTGYPSMVYNGGLGSYFSGNPAGFDNQDAEAPVDDPTTAIFENLSIELDTTGVEKLTFSATLKAKGDIPLGHKAFMVVVEEDISFNSAPGSNGQKDFHWVMKKYVPSVSGVNLSSMSNGDTRNLSGEWELSNVYDNDELAVVFFIQNTSTKEVLNADHISLKKDPDVTIPEDPNTSVQNLFDNNTMSFYPNPAQNEIFLYYDLTETSDVNIKIFDQLGREHKALEISALSGNSTMNIRTKDLNNGLYILQVQVGSEISSEKFLIQR